MAASLTTVLVAGCGGGPRQDADEPTGTYKLEVAAAKFPASQSIAQDARDDRDASATTTRRRRPTSP